jgi:hypothetical protein
MYGGNVYIGDELNSYTGDANPKVISRIPIYIPCVSGNYYMGGDAKALGVKSCSLDLNSSKYKGNWTSGTAYKVGDIVLGTGANSVRTYWRCKTAHTSSSSIPLTNTSYWEDATQSGYIVFSNGLTIQWGVLDGADRGTKTILAYTSKNTYFVFITAKSDAGNYELSANPYSATQFKYRCKGADGSISTKGFWYTIGY